MIDWNAEVNAVETDVEKTLRRALSNCKTWKYVIVLAYEDVSEDGGRLQHDYDDTVTDETRLWMVASYQHKLIHSFDGDEREGD